MNNTTTISPAIIAFTHSDSYGSTKVKLKASFISRSNSGWLHFHAKLNADPNDQSAIRREFNKLSNLLRSVKGSISSLTNHPNYVRIGLPEKPTTYKTPAYKILKSKKVKLPEDFRLRGDDRANAVFAFLEGKVDL